MGRENAEKAKTDGEYGTEQLGAFGVVEPTEEEKQKKDANNKKGKPQELTSPLVFT